MYKNAANLLDTRTLRYVQKHCYVQRGYENVIQLKFGDIQECYKYYIQERHAKPCHQTLVIAPLRLEVLHVLQKLEYKLLRKDYLQINTFPDLVVVERERYLHVLYKKAIREATSEVVRETASWTRPGLTLRMSTQAFTRLFWWQSYIAMSYGNNTRMEGLDVTLDNSADLCG